MKMMTMALAACAAAVTTYGAETCCAQAGACGPYPEKVEEGFVSLFNGKDLTGWCGSQSYGVETITQKLNNGTVREFPVIACQPGKGKGGGGNLCTEREFENFILRFEFCMPPNGNNGLGIRMSDIKKDAAYWAMCELQLLDDGGSQYYDAKAKKDKLKPYQYTGSVYGVVPCRRDNVDKQIWGKEKNFTGGGSYVRKPGMWNFEEVRVIGSEIEVYLNGYLITKADVSKFKGNGDTPDHRKHPGLHNKKGRIGWLGHGHRVMWRNIRIKELPSDAKMDQVCPKQAMACPAGFTPYFTGKESDLANWKGVTTEKKFDNPKVRQAATPDQRAEMQAVADKGMRAHWHVRNGNLFFDGYRGGYSLATKKDYKDFEMWCDWRIMSVTGDSGLRRALQQQEEPVPGAQDRRQAGGRLEPLPRDHARREGHGVAQRRARGGQRHARELLGPQAGDLPGRADRAPVPRRSDRMAEHLHQGTLTRPRAVVFSFSFWACLFAPFSVSYTALSQPKEFHSIRSQKNEEFDDDGDCALRCPRMRGHRLQV